MTAAAAPVTVSRPTGQIFANDLSRPSAGWTKFDRGKGEGLRPYRIIWDGNANPSAGQRVALPGQRFLLVDDATGETFEGEEINNDDMYDWLTTYHGQDTQSQPPAADPKSTPLVLAENPGDATGIVVSKDVHDRLHTAVGDLAKQLPPDQHGWLWEIAHLFRLPFAK